MKRSALLLLPSLMTPRPTMSTESDARPSGSSQTSSVSRQETQMAEAIRPVDVRALLDGCTAEQLDEVVRALRCIKRRQVRQRLKRGAEPKTAPEDVPVGESGRVEH